MRVAYIVLIVLGAAWSTAVAQVTVTKVTGTSVVTQLSDDIAVNKGSSLKREYITLHDAALPADPSSIDVLTFYKGSSGYTAVVKFGLDAKQPLQAIEVKCVLFDVWGDVISVLTSEHVTDIGVGKNGHNEGIPISEAECGYFVSVSFISRVRTASGQVIETDKSAVVARLKEYSKKFTPDVLTGKSNGTNSKP